MVERATLQGGQRSDPWALVTRLEPFRSKSQQVGPDLTREGYSSYKGGLYCGPGWGFTYKDVEDGHIAKLPDAVDAIDEACKAHDQCYQRWGYLTRECNETLGESLAVIIVSKDSTPQQRIDAALMAAWFAYEARYIDDPGKAAMHAREAMVEFIETLRRNLEHTTRTFESEIRGELIRQGFPAYEY